MYDNQIRPTNKKVLPRPSSDAFPSPLPNLSRDSKQRGKRRGWLSEVLRVWWGLATTHHHPRRLEAQDVLIMKSDDKDKKPEQPDTSWVHGGINE